MKRFLVVLVALPVLLLWGMSDGWAQSCNDPFPPNERMRYNCDISSGSGSGTTSGTLRSRINMYNSDNVTDAGCFCVIQFQEDYSIDLTSSIVLIGESRCERTDGTMTGTRIYGGCDNDDNAQVEIDASSFTTEADSDCAFVLTGGLDTKHQIRDITIKVGRQDKAICDENGTSLYGIETPNCGETTTDQCEFGGVNVEVVGGAIVEPEPDRDSDGIPDGQDGCDGSQPEQTVTSICAPDEPGGKKPFNKVCGIEGEPKCPFRYYEQIQRACQTGDQLPGGDLDGDFIANRCDGDMDGDGIWDEDELAAGLNPTNPDTDGDEWCDGDPSLTRSMGTQKAQVAFARVKRSSFGFGKSQRTIQLAKNWVRSSLNLLRRPKIVYGTLGSGYPGCQASDPCPHESEIDGETDTDRYTVFGTGTDPVPHCEMVPEDLPPGGGEAVCGNGLLETGEQCDDGNTEAADGCSAVCAMEVPDLDDDDVPDNVDCDSLDATRPNPRGCVDVVTVTDPDADDDGICDRVEFVASGNDFDPSTGSLCVLFDGMADNCPMFANPDQEDSDDDGVGDECEAQLVIGGGGGDSDGDGIPDDIERTVYGTDPEKADTDGDGLSDLDELSEPYFQNGFGPLNPDLDEDGFCDGPNTVTDASGTVVCTGGDNCPIVANATQVDTDASGEGDACEEDTDGDGFCNEEDDENEEPVTACQGFDNCTYIPNPDQTDSDKNGIGDACDLVLNKTLLEAHGGCGCRLDGSSGSNDPVPFLLMMIPLLVWRMRRQAESR